jgi:pyruvate dehydrogenase E1 component alpha subunit
MHLVDKDVNFYAVPIVASAIPIAVGVAKAIKQRQGKEVVVCFFGDAAMESGQFYEALNLAALWQLPILFVMEDNNLSVSTPKESRQPSYARTTRDLVRSCGVSHFQAYGMDVGKVHEEAGSAIHYTKVGWPRFLECYSLQRYREHCGPNESPDSCDRMMDWVLGLSLRSDCLLGDAVNDAQSEFDEALAFANTSLWPDTSKLEEGVYAN